MKKMFSPFYAVSCSFMLIACAGDSEATEQGLSSAQNQQAKPAQTISLPLVNPSFEASDQLVKGWAFAQHAGEPSYSVSIDSTESADGKNSYRIERKKVQAWGMLNQWIKLDDAIGKSVKLSAMVKSETLGPNGFDLNLVFRKANRKFISSVGSEAVTGSNDWHRIEVIGVVPAGTAHLQVTAVLNDAGTAWLDDVRLSITDEQ
ncbi:MAG: hypothetical protein ABW101_14075 [Candidatus Thiodiazotropha sp.]